MKGWRSLNLRSFAVRLSLYLMTGVVGIFVLTFALLFYSARRHVEREATREAYLSLESTSLRIEAILHTAEGAVVGFSRLAIEHRADTGAIYRLTRQLIREYPTIIGCAVAFNPNHPDYKGSRLSPYAYREGEEIRLKSLHTAEYDYLQQPWYKQVIASEEATWSEPYFDRGGGGQMMTTYAYPLRDRSGEIFAVMTADIALEWLDREVNAIKTYPQSYHFIISGEGRFLAHNDKKALLRESIFSAAERHRDQPLIEAGRRMVAGERGEGRFVRDGKEYLLLYAPIPGVGWSVATGINTRQLFAGVSHMQLIVIGLVVLGVGLLLILSLLTIRHLTRPLTLFAQSADAIARGDLNTLLPPIRSHDEMRRLADAFGNMQQSLMRHIEELHQTTAAKERIESDLRIARAIQTEMLPHSGNDEALRGKVDIQAHLTPAREVGGDLYDYVIQGDQLYFLIGDVSGKGVPAALIMAVTCRLFHTMAPHLREPERILSVLNQTLAEQNESNMFCTAFLGVLDVESGLLRYCNAGHNAPIRLRAGGEVQKLEVISNLPLGLFTDFKYQGQECCLEADETLLLYTDGVSEAEDSQHRIWGEKALLEQLKTPPCHAPRAVIEAVLAGVRRHAQGAEPSDDITLLGVQYHPQKREYRALTLHNRESEIERLNRFLQELFKEWQIPTEYHFNLNLALEEAAVNIIRYAWPQNRPHTFTLEAFWEEDCLRWQFRDNGKPFDPTLQPPIDPTLSAEQREAGGLGIFLTQQLMDEVRYERTEDQNILRLTKYLHRISK